MNNDQWRTGSLIGGWQFGGPLFVNIGKPLRAVQNSSEYVAIRHFTDQVMGSIADLITELKTGESPLPKN